MEEPLPLPRPRRLDLELLADEPLLELLVEEPLPLPRPRRLDLELLADETLLELLAEEPLSLSRSRRMDLELLAELGEGSLLLDLEEEAGEPINEEKQCGEKDTKRKISIIKPLLPQQT